MFFCRDIINHIEVEVLGLLIKNVLRIDSVSICPVSPHYGHPVQEVKVIA